MSLPSPTCFLKIAALALLASVSAAGGQTLLSENFETDPLLSAWTRSGSGAGWTSSEAASGMHALSAETDVWSSPVLETEPLRWYRLSFKSKAPSTLNNIGSSGYAYWSATFYDSNGNLLNDDQYSSVFPSSGWIANEFRIRAKQRPGPNGTLLPVRMKVSFHPLGSQPLFIDDVLLESTTADEVAVWADSVYEGLPAQLDYIPKPNRWQRIPRTMEKLRAGQTLRIVMLGDSIQCDTANAPIDALLQRAYPGSHVELISSTKGGSGVSYFKDHVAEYVTDYLPNLLMIGGISQSDNIAEFQSIVDQVRAHDLANARTTEIMLLTKAWSSNNNFGNYSLSPEIRELDQDPAQNASVPDDYRGHLLTFAHANGLECLDMTGIEAEFIYGPAAAAGVGAPANANGDPYSFWHRDWVHLNDRGKQILGREFEIFFAPTPSLTIEKSQPGEVRLSWSGPANGYELRSTPALLPSPAWLPVSQTPILVGGRRSVVFPILPGISRQFFQLFAQTNTGFSITAAEQPVFADTFTHGSRFALDRMFVHDGFVSGLPGENWTQAAYTFDTPLDVRAGDITVYWAFKSIAAAGPEYSKLYMYLNFTDVPAPPLYPEPARVAMNIRPATWSVLYCDPGWQLQNDPELYVTPTFATFPDAQTIEKFRMVVHWAGDDHITVTPSIWNRTTVQWEPFVPRDQLELGPIEMDLSIATHLFGNTSFKSLYFQAYDTYPELDSVLVTVRPTTTNPAPSSAVQPTR